MNPNALDTIYGIHGTSSERDDLLREIATRHLLRKAARTVEALDIIAAPITLDPARVEAVKRAIGGSVVLPLLAMAGFVLTLAPAILAVAL